MECKLNKWKTRRDFLKLLQYREHSIKGSKIFREQTQFTKGLIERLGLEHELTGHTGCVNCLQWSPDGRHLASGSDDTKVIIWDPFRYKQLHTIPTNHIGNIFSVKFLGYDNIATGAGDCRVFVQSIPGALAKLPPLLECSCHVNRVKRLATSPIEPTFLWSAAEDGFVIQYDLREKHECSPNHTKILIDLSRYFGEVKCIAVNPTKPHYIAVGSNDCYVRMYDRRKLKTCLLRETYQMSENPQTPQEVIDPNCVQYYAPGHLSIDNYDSYSYRLSTTYISFNTAGTEMLANVGGEQIYLYDVNTTRSIKDMQVPQLINGVNRISNPIYNSCCRPEQTRSLDSFKYNELSDEFCACFYMNRAYTFYTRKWMGDLYQAARDYIYVTRHWPHEKQAYIGLIKTFTELKWTKEAQAWMNYFMKMNQDPTNFSQIQTLSNDITNPEFEISKEDREDILRRCGGKRVPSRSIDAAEQTKRLNSRDYEVRFIGHCNTTTDIKEVNFLGESGDYICAGSDEGIIFVWERKLGEVVTAVTGDISIVNCVQPHPTTCLIASSGIDRAVKLWSPQPEEKVDPPLCSNDFYQLYPEYLAFFPHYPMFWING